MPVAGNLPAIPLDCLRAGETGAVFSVDGPDRAVNHLQEIGLRVGCPVRMIRPGPPHLLEIGDVRLCVRPESDVLVMIGLDPQNA